jgi:putative beta-lysine N-acetyltransferase
MGSLPEGFECRWAVPGDVAIMAELYREVFQSYPFPIHKPDYLLSTMQSHVAYFLVFNDNRLVAQSSAEMDEEASNAEMTDFATHPDCRGQGLASYLLHEMEQAMKKRGIHTAYTIARAVSWGMNKTFARLGYDFGGTLINNTQISGAIESMNIWYKTL